jgi:hypothetical protein
MTSRKVLSVFLVSVSLSLVAGCSEDPEVAKREAVGKGDTFRAAGKNAEALIEYRKAVQLDGNYGEARLLADPTLVW